MVRRRTRASKSTIAACDSGTTVSVTNGNLFEDQYFASPKRKDCKIEQNVQEGDTSSAAAPMPSKTEKSIGATKSKSERGGISGKIIGVPLATRSQTKTIESFFKTNHALKNAKSKEIEEEKTNTNTLPSLESNHTPSCNGHDHMQNSSPSLHHAVDAQIQHEFIFDLSEDTNDTDNTELSDEASAGLVDFATHRSSLRDSRSSGSSVTDNIFLQEPVLTLNVDKTPNQASSIKIIKSLEIEPIFSSPPSLTTVALNGRFNQIVSLNGSRSPSKRDFFGFESRVMNGLSVSLHDNDNSSCDSGVALTNTIDNTNSQSATLTAVQTRRRKPATPHRILCPSPIKSSARIVTPNGMSPTGKKGVTQKDQLSLSPRKSHRQMAAANSKSRRRLNQQKEQVLYNPTIANNSTAKPIQNGFKQNGYIDYDKHKIDTITVDDDLDFENLDDEDVCVPVASANEAKPQIREQDSAPKTQSKGKSSGAKVQQTKAKQQHSQPLAITNGNREMTEFFPVRRSVRKTKSAVKEEMMRNLEKAILEERQDGLRVAEFNGKGRGIVADRCFQRGEFVVEYIGDLISMTEAAEREKNYAMDANAGCYMYYFKHKNQQYCIDATIDTGKFGRLVNHSRNGNLVTKVVVVKQRPHLILIAKDDIEPGDELCYDYGDRSKESLMHHPWLAF